MEWPLLNTAEFCGRPGAVSCNGVGGGQRSLDVCDAALLATAEAENG